MIAAPRLAARPAILEPIAIGAILVALTVRPASPWSSWLFVATGIVVATFLRRPLVPAGIEIRPALAASGLGIAAFLLVRVLAPGRPVSLGVFAIGVVVIAAIIEEAFFRGLVHERLRERGLGPVLVGLITATAFAAIHLTTYGAWVLPLDLAAGGILAWQREVSGTWLVPAATHVVANLLQLG